MPDVMDLIRKLTTIIKNKDERIRELELDADFYAARASHLANKVECLEEELKQCRAALEKEGHRSDGLLAKNRKTAEKMVEVKEKIHAFLRDIHGRRTSSASLRLLEEAADWQHR